MDLSCCTCPAAHACCLRGPPARVTCVDKRAAPRAGCVHAPAMHFSPSLCIFEAQRKAGPTGRTAFHPLGTYPPTSACHPPARLGAPHPPYGKQSYAPGTYAPGTNARTGCRPLCYCCSRWIAACSLLLPAIAGSSCCAARELQRSRSRAPKHVVARCDGQVRTHTRTAFGEPTWERRGCLKRTPRREKVLRGKFCMAIYRQILHGTCTDVFCVRPT